jgi:hypothetical protein
MAGKKEFATYPSHNCKQHEKRRKEEGREMQPSPYT